MTGNATARMLLAADREEVTANRKARPAGQMPTSAARAEDWNVMQDWGIALIGVPLGFTVGTLGEYWIHRGMHKGGVLAGGHGEHHREGWGQGAFKEFRDYTLGTGIALLIGLPIDVFFLTGGMLAGSAAFGGLLHAFFAAWCHQAQHEDPRLLPWMAATPVHFVHHKRQQARHNFGISVDWWDRVFRTYKVDSDWRGLVRVDRARLRPWQIHWFTPNTDKRSAARHRLQEWS